MCTDGVHCRDFAGTGPVVLKELPVTGAAFSGFTMDQVWSPLFSTPTIDMEWACVIRKVADEVLLRMKREFCYEPF